MAQNIHALAAQEPQSVLIFSIVPTRVFPKRCAGITPGDSKLATHKYKDIWKRKHLLRYLHISLCILVGNKHDCMDSELLFKLLQDRSDIFSCCSFGNPGRLSARRSQCFAIRTHCCLTFKGGPILFHLSAIPAYLFSSSGESDSTFFLSARAHAPIPFAGTGPSLSVSFLISSWKTWLMTSLAFQFLTLTGGTSSSLATVRWLVYQFVICYSPHINQLPSLYIWL